MPIRKYGTEPAKTEIRTEDNDPETLNSVKKQAQRKPEPQRTDDDEQPAA